MKVTNNPIHDILKEIKTSTSSLSLLVLLCRMLLAVSLHHKCILTLNPLDKVMLLRNSDKPVQKDGGSDVEDDVGPEDGRILPAGKLKCVDGGKISIGVGHLAVVAR